MDTYNQHAQRMTGTGQAAYSSTVSAASATPEPQLYYIHTDHLGTPQELTDRNGNLQWIGQYRAWGELAKASDSEGNAANVEMPLRFQGQYFDKETGLHYNRFRYYDPKVGRFTTQDPISLAGGINLYQYAPNPVQWVDPSGLHNSKITKVEDCGYDYLVELHHNDYPQTHGHINDAIDSGHPDIVTVQREDAKRNRRASLRGVPTQPGKDRDEWPMAMFREGGEGASVRYIDPSDNRGAGSVIGHMLSDIPDGTKVKFKVIT